MSRVATIDACIILVILVPSASSNGPTTRRTLSHSSVQTFDAGRYTWASKGIFVAILLSVLIGLAGNPIYGFTVVLGAEVGALLALAPRKPLVLLAARYSAAPSMEFLSSVKDVQSITLQLGLLLY